MATLFEDLKKAREEKGIPLAQISDITRISEDQLQAIENGNVTILPQAYVRAFLREYADVVGLSPDDVMRRYDALASEAHPAPESGPAAPPPGTPSEPPSDRKGGIMTATTARVALAIVAVAILVVVAWNLAGRNTGPTTEEIPFQNVITQEEARLAPAQTEPPAVAPVQKVPTDSLTLRASTTDSVWMVIQADSLPSREYLFPPNTRASWKARDRFLVTVGNSAAVDFTLNQKSLGKIGKPGTVVRKYEINRKTAGPAPKE